MSALAMRTVDGFLGAGVWGWVRGPYAVSVGRLSDGSYLVVLFRGTNFITECRVATPPRSWAEAIRLVLPSTEEAA